MGSESVVAIDSLNHYFGKGQLKKQVLSNINLTIDRGEIVLMTGPSGSGKTTLLTKRATSRSWDNRCGGPPIASG
jgi:putative ABC transport system ATP-binding protein